mgnify:CR=1 FL=1
MNKKSFGKGLQDGIPIGLGYFAVSFTFGIMAIQSGLTAWQAVLISLTNLTSAGQFAGIGIIAAGGSLWEMALTQLVINLRYCLMSFSLSQKLEKGVSNGHRLAVAFGVTDEIFGVSASQEGRISPWYNYGVMCVAIPGWTLGTLAGFPGKCIECGNLWNVSCGDHSTGKEKSSCSWRSDRSDGCEYVICSGSGTE